MLSAMLLEILHHLKRFWAMKIEMDDPDDFPLLSDLYDIADHVFPSVIHESAHYMIIYVEEYAC